MSYSSVMGLHQLAERGIGGGRPLENLIRVDGPCAIGPTCGMGVRTGAPLPCKAGGNRAQNPCQRQAI